MDLKEKTSDLPRATGASTQRFGLLSRRAAASLVDARLRAKVASVVALYQFSAACHDGARRSLLRRSAKGQKAFVVSGSYATLGAEPLWGGRFPPMYITRTASLMGAVLLRDSTDTKQDVA